MTKETSSDSEVQEEPGLLDDSDVSGHKKNRDVVKKSDKKKFYAFLSGSYFFT